MGILGYHTVTEWLLLYIAAFCLGVSKGGLKGTELLNVTIMAIVLGSKQSTGVVLPLLCFADIMAVKYYNRHAQWKYFFNLLPWMVIGIFMGVYAGMGMNEVLFRKIMALIIIVIVTVMLLLEIKKNIVIPASRSFGALMGLICGFTTMLGNLAGPFSNIYFLALRLPKNAFIGTAAWVFLVINFFKLPFQVIFWNNINSHTLYTDLIVLPALLVGFYVGVKIVGMIREESYRKIIIALTFVGGVFIFLK
ncbi:MAG: sulfite exporter TauE/SafE family protein [Chitinophagaceae bacterium]|nr:sulfite exporter TauE/SafE family protein [Chitinophagaceae bacterium]